MSQLPAAAATSQFVTLPNIPELYDPDFLSVLLHDPPKAQPAESANAIPQNAMMDALKETAHQTLTDNAAPAYDSTLSATLDCFQALQPGAVGANIHKHLGEAWKEDPDLTLRMIWNARSVHDGKGDRELFYQAWGWLFRNHPRTAIHNLHCLIDPVCIRPNREEGQSHGYWKDLLNILALATLDQLGPLKGQQRAPFLDSRPERAPKRQRQYLPPKPPSLSAAEAKAERAKRAAEAHETLTKKLDDSTYRALYVAVARLFSSKLALEFQILQQAEALPTDAEGKVARKGLLRQLSLVGKWAPSPAGAHDKVTNIASAIALLLHRAEVTQYGETPLKISVGPNEPMPAAETHVLRSFMQRWVLAPLRKATAVTETFMGSKRWTEIPYGRVPSTCMSRNMEHFYLHDPEGFEKYLTEVEAGRRSISGATLMPHELVEEAYAMASDVKLPGRGALAEVKQKVAKAKTRVVDAQWRTLVSRLKESGQLESSLAICDVSGSMGSVHNSSGKRRKRGEYVPPILPAVSLSLVLAQLAKPPFDSGFVTFSRRPEFVKLDFESEGLLETVNRMSRSAWGMNTDLHAVFVKLLLPLAVKNKVPRDEMIKRLFVFSDMQFDVANSDNPGHSQSQNMNPADWETNHDAIRKAYEEAGYDVPQIVYWNLAAPADKGLRAMPVQGNTKGVALMNGFSPAMLKVFMGEEVAEDGSVEEWEKIEAESADDEETAVAGDETMDTAEDEFTPVKVMRKALMKKSFDGLVVVD